MSCSSCSTTNQINIRQGESKTLEFTVRDAKKNLTDLTTGKIYFSVKNRVEDTVYVFQLKSLAAGGDGVQIVILDQTSPLTLGKFQVYLAPALTQNLCTDDTYVYDVWVIPANNKTYDLIPPSPFNIEPAVTDLSPV